MTSYTLTSVKAIEFYKKNPSLDFNHVNELFVELIEKITNTIKDSISVNEVKALLHSIHKKVENVEQCATTTNQLIQMTHDNIGEQKQFYVQQMKDVLQSRKEESEILNLIRETNNAFLDKTTYSILQQFPKLTNDIKSIQKDMLEYSQSAFQKIAMQSRGEHDPKHLEHFIQTQYQCMNDKMMSTLQNMFSQESVFYQNNMELKNFLEKQKNSTKKGKESENKLEICLNDTFPNGSVVDKSGESKACDYLLQRNEKCDIFAVSRAHRNQSNSETGKIKQILVQVSGSFSRQMTLKLAFKTAIGMSLISMIGMEVAMNATDYFLTGGAILTWWVVPIMLVVGFVTPWPYNYWRLKKFNEACH